MRWATVTVGLLIAASIAWFAGEQHYDNCIQAAEAKYPLSEGREASGWEQYGGTDPDDPLSILPPDDEFLDDRQAALDDCSRLPV